MHQQIGFMRPDGSVETSATPAANNVNQLVQMVLLNYMALHNEQGLYAQIFGNSPVAASAGSVYGFRAHRPGHHLERPVTPSSVALPARSTRRHSGRSG